MVKKIENDKLPVLLSIMEHGDYSKGGSTNIVLNSEPSVGMCNIGDFIPQTEQKIIQKLKERFPHQYTVHRDISMAMMNSFDDMQFFQYAVNEAGENDICNRCKKMDSEECDICMWENDQLPNKFELDWWKQDFYHVPTHEGPFYSRFDFIMLPKASYPDFNELHF